MSPRFEHKPLEFVGITSPTLVYIGVKDRADFDKIAAPCHDSGENANGHVLCKRVGKYRPGEVTVIFQYWLKVRTFEALAADARKSRLERERNELDNSFGQGAFRDGQIRDRIAAINAELLEIAGSSSSQSADGPVGDAVSNPSPAPSSIESGGQRDG